MSLAEFVEHVPEQWQAEFMQFVTTGDATDEFLAFVDSHEPTQQAVEAALAIQMESFEKFARHLNVDPTIVSEHLRRLRAPGDEAHEASAKIVSGLLTFVALPAHERKDVVRQVAAQFGNDPATKEQAKRGIEDMKVALAGR